MDLAPAHTAKTSQLLFSEFGTSVDWPPYLLDLELLDFSICSVLQAKVQVTLHANLDSLHPSITSEWDQLVAEYICKALPVIPDTAGTLAVDEKNEVKIA